ncbi:hypothetical protein CCR75_009380 [Bremia lactucae]|uniref:Letm1 RBD domain-containing protein n=1 Tax=Bremia lactucae TaxID=4779 RepID=A0A976FI12_BRELC|nr:hypothetical protein CCR75_009380 [Bremia lactucae]
MRRRCSATSYLSNYSPGNSGGLIKGHNSSKRTWKQDIRQALSKNGGAVCDDQQLLTGGVDDLSLRKLEFACHKRGILLQYGEIHTLRDVLNEWLSMHDIDHFNSKTKQQTFPPSLLQNAPTLSSFGQPKTGSILLKAS